MDRERWNRAKTVFSAASRLPTFLRRGWVWFTCGRDMELRRLVLRLLDNAALRDSFLDLSPDTTGPRLPVGAPVGRTLPDLELLEELGQGGMGVVYKAKQVSLNRFVAVKMLPDLLAVSESRRQAFENESRVIAGLKHPNIVPVFWSGRTDKAAYYVMEYVDGRSLDRVLAESGTALEPAEFLKPANVAHFVSRLANALEATHSHGVMHRDVKPGNVLVTHEGEPRLVDFGLARSIDRHSLTSRVIGTPHYMSPEQARLQDVRIDHRTDVYSLGVVMYEMLTRRRPFEGHTLAEIFIAIRERDPVRVRKLNPAVPRDLETICHKAMRKRPEQRYASAADFEADLQAFLEHRSPRAQPLTLFERLQSGVERHRTATIVLALGLLLVPVVKVVWDTLLTWKRTAELVQALPTAAAPALAASDLQAVADRLRDDRRTLDDLRTLRELRHSLDQATQARADAAEALVRADLARLHTALQDEIAGNLQRGLSEPGGTEVALLSRQSALLSNVLEAEGNEHPDQRLPELLLPRITLATQPPGATVMARRLDPSTGLVVDATWQQLGTSDLVGLPIAPGYYRFVAIAPDGRYGEFTQLVAGNGATHALPELVLRPTDEVERGMVHIAAGKYITTPEERKHREQPGTLPIGESEPVGAFLVDDHELTNSEYRAFCEDTGRDAPTPPFATDATWDSLPVAFVDVYSAESYAAWAGKRLLTKVEWRQALGGKEHRPLPWGDAPSDLASMLQRANLRGPDTQVRPLEPITIVVPAPDRATQDWTEYMRLVRPVRSYPDGRSLEGVYDLLGNVEEWTDSISVNKVASDLWRPEPGTHLVLGLSFWDQATWLDSDLLVHSQSTSPNLGFRCGRTAPEELPSVH